MIDIHSHILPGIDDGAKTIEESLKIIEEAKAVGFTKIITTPHYLEDRFNVEEEKRIKLIKSISEKEKDIKIEIGNEIYANPKILSFIEQKKASTLANSRYVLFEIPFRDKIVYFNQMVDDLKRNGYLLIIAHPERYEIVMQNPKIVEEWKKRGIYLQCNYESIIGRYGKQSKKLMKLFLKHKLVDFLGSDVHRIGTYEKVAISISKIKEIVNDEYFEKLSKLNQEKVINNEKIEIEEWDEIKKTIFGNYK